jgi:tRNA dimethylallyltransferase
MGPTGSGKTDFLKRLDPDRYEIVSCDSRQVYTGMEIGTAAPVEETRKRVRHHLVNFLSPAESINASVYSALAREAVRDILSRGKVPVVAGGTGFYYSALKNGLFDAPVDQTIRERVHEMGPELRRESLFKLDPKIFVAPGEQAMAGRIHPNDDYRIGRALEITLGSGRPWTEHWREHRERGLQEFELRGWQIEVELQSYRERLDLRVREMLRAGFVEEAAMIYRQFGNCPALRSLGYDLALESHFGRMDPETLRERLVHAHYQYGRKQRIWFKKEMELAPVRREDLHRIALPHALS